MDTGLFYSTIQISDFPSDFLKQEKIARFQMGAVLIQVRKCICSWFGNNFKNHQCE